MWTSDSQQEVFITFLLGFGGEGQDQDCDMYLQSDE